MKFLNSKIGYFFYLILQNRFVQRYISEDEKQKIIEINNKHNNVRKDYNWKDYQSGRNWTSFNKEEDYRNWLRFIPLFNRNVKILEIGPGSGYYSRFICENKNVVHYSFCELNINFRDYLKDNLKKLQHTKKNFDFYSFEEDFLIEKTTQKYDYIFFISSFHHIPNREDYFKKCFNLLNEKGKIIFIEPTHYLFRNFIIIKKLLNDYKKYKKNQILENCSTHAFCTIAELKFISRNFKGKYNLENSCVVRSKKINKNISYIKIKFIKILLQNTFQQK